MLARMDRTPLIVCPSCDCHVTASERDCPLCGAPMRSSGSGRGKTAASMLFGVAVAIGLPATVSACYGMASTIGDPNAPSSTGADGGTGEAGQGGAGGQGAGGGQGGLGGEGGQGG
jgi:hypothetical protein